MQDKVTYEYAIIKIVPKVEREEFFNVGVLLFSKRKKFLGMAFQIDEAKLKVFKSDLEMVHLNAYLSAWKRITIGNPNGNPIEQMELSDRFRWLAAAKSSVIQCSKTHSGLCNEPEEELKQLFKMFVQ
ncbi:DUF3037 domain-containing protein [Putridiphycobacter roseus]|uniref:DUF3037 domain-containing protein n=1 Tax=Putridiphycobacter roseus TaxID=2219161 RepID=A0A2W1MZA1_9FLAO|nr:DUF3037 domain-containing protein [Putridiphycobacter roseus]PZE17237.1 DUF3037 domain-containing protein [Putridiphycobacter roseus]